MRRRVAIARTLAAVVLAPLLLLAAAPLALKVPAVRARVVTAVNRALAEVLTGKLTIDRADGIALTHVEGVDAHLDGEDGRPLLRVRGLAARVSTWTLVRSLLGHGDVLIEIPQVSLGDVDVLVDQRSDGAWRIARAFEPRKTVAPSAHPRSVRLSVGRLLLAKGAVRLHAGEAGPAIDADVAGAQANLSVTPEKLAIDLPAARLVVRGLPERLTVQGTVEAHLEQGLGDRPTPLALRAHWLGAVGAIPESLDAALDADGVLHATLEAGPAGPEAVRTVWPGCPLTAPAQAHIEASGSLDRLAVSGEVRSGLAAVDVRGTVRAAGDRRAALHVDARGLDARVFAPQAPHTDWSSSGDLTVAAPAAGPVSASATIDFPGGAWGAEQLPATKIAAQCERCAAADRTARAELTIADPRAPTAVVVRLEPAPRGPRLYVEAESSAPRLEAVAPLGGVAHGAARVHAAGTVDLGTNAIDATLTGTLSAARAGAIGVGTASFSARASGPIGGPSVEMTLHAEGVDAGAVPLQSVDARGDLRWAGALVFRDVSVDAVAGEVTARLRAASGRVSPEGVQVEGGRLEGFGEPIDFAVRATSSAASIRAHGARVDLQRVRAAFPFPLRSGELAFDADGSVTRDAAAGRLVADVQHAAFKQVDDARAHVDLRLAGREASGEVSVGWASLGQVTFHASGVHVPEGRLVTAAPWRRAWGTVDLDGDVDLTRLPAALASALPAGASLGGSVELRGHVTRATAGEAMPTFDLSAATRGLSILWPHAPAPWRVDGLDSSLHARVDGETGETHLDARASDGAGTLAEVQASAASVPYAALFGSAHPLQAIEDVPVEARLDVPPRALKTLPAWSRPGVVTDGEVEAHLAWSGPPAQPRVTVTANVRGAKMDPTTLSLPLDASFEGSYDGARLDGSLRAQSRGRPVLSATTQVDLRARDVLDRAPGGDVPWTADAQIEIDRFPLQRFTFLDDRQVRGNLTGRASLEGLHRDARAQVSLAFDGLQIGDVRCKASKVTVSVDGRALDVQANLDHSDGSAQLRAHLGATWGAALLPRLDPSQPASGSLSAKQLRAAVLEPFLTQWLSQLDGRIDAGLQLIAEADGKVKPQGTVVWNNGVFELTSFGEEFHDASATLTLTPDGVARLAPMSAHGLSGFVQAAASVRLDGWSASGASAEVVVPAKDPLPVVVNGVKLAMVDGRFAIKAARDPADRAWDVDLDVTGARAQLPPTTASLGVQSLGPIEGVKVGVVRPGGFVELPLETVPPDTQAAASARPTPVRVKTHLAQMQVIRGSDLDVRLDGETTAVLSDPVKVSGQIRLSRGTLDVQGKAFTIENGTVTFVGDDPANPQVVLTADWQAPDATMIYAEFVGPLKTGKVRLRSEPAKSQSEILALVIFGTTDQSGTGASTSTSTSTTTTTVAAAAGGAATQPINRALGGLDRALGNAGVPAGISTKIDTSQVNPRPEVEVQIARDISLQIAWVLGVPPPGTDPDTTLVTLSWHFLRNWSLATTVGDHGTSILDLIWQHRY